MVLLPCQGLCKGWIGIPEQLLLTHPTTAFHLGLNKVRSWEHVSWPYRWVTATLKGYLGCRGVQDQRQSCKRDPGTNFHLCHLNWVFPAKWNLKIGTPKVEWFALVWSTPSSSWTHQDLTKGNTPGKSCLVKSCPTVSIMSGNTVLCIGHLHRHRCSGPGFTVHSTTPLCVPNLWSCHQERWAGQTEYSNACSSLLSCPAIFFFLDLSVHNCRSCPGLHIPLHTTFEANHASVVSHMSNFQMFKPVLHIPALWTLGRWSTWSVTHWAAGTGEWGLSSRVQLCRCLWYGAFGRKEERERGRKSKTSIVYFPSLLVCLWDLAVASMTI